MGHGVPSPSGWIVPAGAMPGWNWAPPGGLRLRLDRIPRWARIWYRTPFVDRYAHVWMWEHGGWNVDEPSSAAGPDPAGVREPLRPRPKPVLGSGKVAAVA
jgi:hypothetical protein